MRTVEIIGGGLAGLGLGIVLRRRAVPVTLHEAGRYPRHRVCGEFITSLDDATKDALGLQDVLLGARKATGVSWCEEGKKDIRHRLTQPALCLSRHALDKTLASNFESLGGVLRENSRAHDTPEEGRVQANGRKPKATSRWVGIKQHFRDLTMDNDLEVHLGNCGYIGLTKVENGTVNVCGLLRRGSVDLRRNMVEIAGEAGFRELSSRLSSATPDPTSLCMVAGLDYGPAAAGDALRIGDREAMIPPFTGNGMTIALQSAAVVAEPLEAWAREKSDWQEACTAAAAAQKSRFGIRLSAGRFLHPLLFSPLARSAARGLNSFGALPIGFLYKLMH